MIFVISFTSVAPDKPIESAASTATLTNFPSMVDFFVIGETTRLAKLFARDMVVMFLLYISERDAIERRLITGDFDALGKSLDEKERERERR